LLEFGPLDHSVPDRHEGISDVRADGVYGVPGTHRLAVVDHRDVHALRREDPLPLGFLQLRLAGLERLIDPATGSADSLARVRLGARWKGPDLAVGQCE